MPTIVILGAQWGDEGKGKIVDVLAEGADLTVRYAGGANAGHTIVAGGTKYVLHLIPSGVLHKRGRALIAGGTVVDVSALCTEIDTLSTLGVDLSPKRLGVAAEAHIITPYHILLDKLSGGAIGTTGRGIGPCYAEKARRTGLRAGDFATGRYREVLEAQEAYYSKVLPALYGDVELPSLKSVLAQFEALRTLIVPYLKDVPALLASAVANGEHVLFEGAQGAELDLDYGSYPFVTSSTTSAAGALSGTGVFCNLDARLGVVKAYATRVGNGPFPTELVGAAAEHLRTKGGEYGATTGRPRRVGWLDLPLLKKAHRTSGFTGLAVTKLDILSGEGPIQVCVNYTENGRPVLRELEGFEGDLATVKSWDGLPKAARTYLEFIEREMNVPVALLSTGAERSEIISHNKLPW